MQIMSGRPECELGEIRNLGSTRSKREKGLETEVFGETEIL